MERIASFCVDHLKLNPGLYVSRRDEKNGVVVTTFDIRVTKPNCEPAIDTGALHTMEHIGATYLRNSAKTGDIVYFGPMGCKTGFYLVMFGDLQPEDILDLILDTFKHIAQFKGDIPGASAVECGNYSLQNPDMANFYAKKYVKALTQTPCFIYE